MDLIQNKKKLYKYTMVNTSAIWQQATNSHLGAQQEPYKKAQPLTKNIWEFSGGKKGESTISRQKEQKD